MELGLLKQTGYTQKLDDLAENKTCLTTTWSLCQNSGLLVFYLYSKSWHYCD